ncbi:hypothetical protein DL764_001577 [Monosporascus ibericus]|uniref:Uncharacterized protein n=1 Tax=Monosporascus ibericus TaxID=155417 RepID=A0A4Q4TNX5_9PEZI|nr:hypothetical protein DL764_001577 [Monosporascus ibericus]
MVHNAARPAKANQQGRASYSRPHADRRVHSRWGSMGSSALALQYQRRQSCTSGNDDSNYSVATSSNANPDRPSGPNTVDTTKSGNMSQILSMSNCMEDVVPDLSTAGLDHIHNSNGSLLPHDDTMNDFDFQEPLPARHDISDQCSQNGDLLSDFVDSLPPTDVEMPHRLSRESHCPSCCCSSTGSATKAFTVDSGSSMEERFDSVVEFVQNSGFKSIDDMVLSYYTAAFDEDSDIFHEQRMSRKRGLPVMLSRLRSSTAAWREYEREAYQAEVLKSAESLLVGECRRLFASPAFHERLAHLRSGAMHPPPPSSSSSSSFHDGGFSSGTSNTAASQSFASSVSNPKTWLSEELPNVWKLVSALSGCRAGSQPVAAVLLTLCFAEHLQAEDVRLLLQSTAT